MGYLDQKLIAFELQWLETLTDGDAGPMTQAAKAFGADLPPAKAGQWRAPFQGARLAARALERTPDSKELADQVLALLQNAEACGWRDPEDLQASPLFAPLRTRADFQQLLRRLADKSDSGK